MLEKSHFSEIVNACPGLNPINSINFKPPHVPPPSISNTQMEIALRALIARIYLASQPKIESLRCI